MKHLKTLRKQARLSLDTAAGSINKTPSWLHKVEAGTIKITLIDTINLLKVYGKKIVITDENGIEL